MAADADFSARYTSLTKEILLKSIEIERFSLNYRMENLGHHNAIKKAVFFGTQEAGAAGTLAFEIGSMNELNKGRRRLLSLNKGTLRKSLRTAEITSIIAASGSAFALTSNLIDGWHRRKKGFDTRTADRYVASHLKDIDDLLAQREALVTANKDHPAHERAVLEGEVLKSLRSAFVDEYARFSASSRSTWATQNLFFLLNAAYNTVGAVSAGIGCNAVNKPKLNGPSNILFTITGAMATAAPLICTATLCAERKLIMRSERRRLHASADGLSKLSAQLKQLETADSTPGSLMPSLPATQRAGIYTDSNQLFISQLENETTVMRRLDKVALQDSLMGPAIGGLFMTQGIMGTKGYYDYFPRRPKKMLDLQYKGTIIGTVGASMAVVGNAAWLLASMSYEHRLRKQHRLPAQLIQDRLQHLADLEQTVRAL